MLAFILLVVLGGGVGLLVVSLAESAKPATDGGGSERAEDAQEDPVLTPTDSEAAVPAQPVPVPSTRPRRQPDPRHVPRSYTAVEGLFDEVALPPLWRRLLSLVAILVIALVIGVALAAVTAAVIGTIAELVDAAVG